MRGKNLVIVILLLIIFFLLGFGLSYYLFNVKGNNDTKQEEKVQEPKQEEKKEEPKEEPKQEEVVYNFNETYDKENLKEILTEAGLNLGELNSIAEFKGEDNKVGKSFTYNNKTIYVGCEVKLTTTKPSNCELEYELEFYVYEKDGFIFGYYNYPSTGGSFSIYDKNLNRIKYGTIGDGIFVINDDVFYGLNQCEGKRTDGKKAEAVEVHRFNTKEGKDYVMFSMDHNAGWAC